MAHLFDLTKGHQQDPVSAVHAAATPGSMGNRLPYFFRILRSTKV